LTEFKDKKQGLIGVGPQALISNLRSLARSRKNEVTPMGSA